MNVEVTGPQIYFTIPILGGINITQTTVSIFVVTALLITACILLGRGLRKRPTGKQVLLEKGIMMIYNMVCETMGKNNAHWTPFILTVFVSSICGSIIGMTGFLRSTTADLSVTLAWAVLVSVVIWGNSIKNNGFVGWLKGFTEPVVVMTPMNLISEIAQPVSMAFRHFGNVAGGGVITGILYTALATLSAVLLNLIESAGWAIGTVVLLAGAGLIVLGQLKKSLKRSKRGMLVFFGGLMALLGIFGILQSLGILSGIPILQFGIPAVLSLYFDVFSAFVQALVFSLLTMVYIAGSCPEPEN